MPDSEYYPPPEDFEVEELALLASLIDHRVLEHELIVDILNIELEWENTYLVNHVRKQTLPRGPDGVIHRREYVGEEHLSTVTVLCSEPDLSKD